MKPDQLRGARDAIQLIDVRQPNEWEAGRVEGAVHIPLGQLVDRLESVNRRQHVVVMCRTGPRSDQATEFLTARGYQAEILEGGIRAWVESGLPIVAADGGPGSIEDPIHEPPETVPAPDGETDRRGFAIPAIGDLDLAGTLADTAEKLGYATVWTDDRPEADGLVTAAAMLKATTNIRVGVGPVVYDRRTVDETVRRLAGRGLDLSRLVIVAGAGGSSESEPSAGESGVARFLSGLRRQLGAETRLGVAGADDALCRLAGQVADLVLLEWVSPDRIRGARAQVDQGRTAAGRADSPEVVAYVRTTFGEGAMGRLSAAADAARSSLAPERDAAELGVAALGVAATAPAWARALLRPYEAVLDEVAVKPVVKLPSAASPDLGQVFYPLSVLLEIAQGLRPASDVTRV